MMGTRFPGPLCQCIYVSPCTLGGKFRNPPFTERASKQLSIAWAEARVMVLVGPYSDGFSS